MDKICLRTRVTRRGDELVVAIPEHLQPHHVREGDEVSLPLPRPAPHRSRARRTPRHR